MQQAIATALPIVLALILLPAIAFATPPDPSWIAGFYDGADGDDIVSLVYETSAASVSVLSPFGPLPCLLELSLESIVSYIPRHHFAGGPRSPPVLCSPEFADVFASLPPPSNTYAPVTLPSITTSRLSQHCDLAALHIDIDTPCPKWLEALEHVSPWGEDIHQLARVAVSVGQPREVLTMLTIAGYLLPVNGNNS